MNIPVMTIDGPSGAGKGTISRAVAKRLGWNYLDSGSIYRALAIASKNAGIDLNNEVAVAEVAQAMMLEFECREELTVRLDHQDITAQLGLEATGKGASIVAVYPNVRAILLQKQRDFQQPPGLVADGRDMGTVVFPHAEYKVFLTASVEERGLRRYKQLIEKGNDANLAAITFDLEERDRRDRERETAPLKMADDAYYIDSSNLSIDQVIDEVISLTLK